MRIRNVKNAKEIINSSQYIIKTPEEYKGKYQELFNNDHDIHLEIGTGKGDFIINMALKYPNINFIGVEKYDSIVAKALLKLSNKDIPNLKIMVLDALSLDRVFESEIKTIYLNFSDPWPKARHEKRRLTSNVFLPIYDKICKGDNIIIQKTDNLGLFASSIVSLSTYGYKIVELSLDLASSGIDNVITEYESKFMSQGIKINYLKAVRK